jgi:endosialidase-like protein
MKTISQLSFLIILTTIVNSSIVAQTPHAFNYQGVIRNAEGAVLQNADVIIKFNIINGADDSIVFSENHSITSNAQGVVSLVVGEGLNNSGSITTINWSTGDYALGIEVSLDEGATFNPMGEAKLVAVPYALYSKNAEAAQTIEGDFWNVEDGNLYYNNGKVGIGTNQPVSNLEIKGTSINNDNDPLFAVVNNTGDTVFAVFQSGVRIYVDDNATKATGNKGGFAVGGFSSGKGITHEYLRVTPDSTRIYIKEPTTKSTKGGFAISGIGQSKEDAQSLMSLTSQNYFIGHEAGVNNTEGLYNTFIGYNSGYTNTVGLKNIFLGYNSGFSNINGNANVFIGDSAGFYNENGWHNIFIGSQAGRDNNSGSKNICLGAYAGRGLVSGWNNMFLGELAGYRNTVGNSNIFMGNYSGINNTEGSTNIFIGKLSGRNNTVGSNNIFIGLTSGKLNIDGSENIFMGVKSGYSNTIGFKNIFMGYHSGYSNIDGFSNIFMGDSAGFFNESGSRNIFMGNNSGTSNLNGYQNVFMGFESGYSNTSGRWNVFIGSRTGTMNTTGQRNVIIGASSGYGNTTGENNVFVGNWCGPNNTTGSYNVFFGHRAGWNNTTGNKNIFVGSYSGFLNKAGEDNIFFGTDAGHNSDTCSYNVFIGNNSGYSNTNGNRNIFMGVNSGFTNYDGSNNIFLGNHAGFSNFWGYKNVFIGDSAGYFSEGGRYNIFIGDKVGYANTEGMANVIIGATAGKNNTTGRGNTFIGNWSGLQNTTGIKNTYLGNMAGWNNVSGSFNVFLGNNAGLNELGSGKLYIANWAADSTQALIYGEFDNDMLRFNGKVGINAHPEENDNLYIEDTTIAGAKIRISGSGSTYNYSSLVLESIEETNKRWHINHRIQDNKLNFQFRDETGYHEKLAILDSGGVVITDRFEFNMTDSISSLNEIFFTDFGQIRSSDDNHRIIFDRSQNIFEIREFGNIVFSTGADLGQRTEMMVLDNLGNLVLNGSFNPKTADAYDIGSPSNAWAAIYTTDGTVQTSDIRLKSNISNLGYGLNEIMKLRPVTFNWKGKEAEKPKLGLIAQEVDEVIHEVVNHGQDVNETLGINYSDLIPVLIKGMQEQQTEIELLKEQNKILLNRVANLENK